MTPIRVNINQNKGINIKCFLDDQKTFDKLNEKNHTLGQKKDRKKSDVRINNKSFQTHELKKLISKSQSSEWDKVKF